MGGKLVSLYNNEFLSTHALQFLYAQKIDTHTYKLFTISWIVDQRLIVCQLTKHIREKRFALMNCKLQRAFGWYETNATRYMYIYNTNTVLMYIDTIKSRIIIIFWLSSFVHQLFLGCCIHYTFPPTTCRTHIEVFRLCFTWINRIIVVFLMHFKCVLVRQVDYGRSVYQFSDFYVAFCARRISVEIQCDCKIFYEKGHNNQNWETCFLFSYGIFIIHTHSHTEKSIWCFISCSKENLELYDELCSLIKFTGKWMWIVQKYLYGQLYWCYILETVRLIAKIGVDSVYEAWYRGPEVSMAYTSNLQIHGTGLTDLGFGLFYGSISE